MQPVRFIMVGGFLGAGKTTTLSRLASTLIAQGHRVGLVTNDQAANLVDTTNLRSQGFAVEEVPGACFCCRFDDLVGKVGQLEASQRPDIILAEPVGSCTDLVATVVQPLKDLYSGRFVVAPYAVLFKPSHGLKILRNEGSGFSPKAAYIFRKQLEEADGIVINRIDEMDAKSLKELHTLLEEQFPGTPVLQMSAKTGQGVASLLEFLSFDGSFGRKILDIDYDIYAEGEAELGWLNSTATVKSNKVFALDDLLMKIIQQLKLRLQEMEGEIGHLKLIGLDDGHYAVANLVSTTTEPELSLPSNCQVSEVELIINARVAMDPLQLEQEVMRITNQVAAEFGANVKFRESQQLRPGRPTPTHRYAQVKI